jgi:hypothetical protein
MNVPSLGHVRLVIVAARKWSADTPRVYIFWPAYIYPVEPRKEPNFGYRLLRTIHSVFRLLFPNRVIQADDLARAMVDIVIRRTREPKGLVLENRDIRAMVGSLHPSSRDCEWSPIWSGACRYAAPNTTASALVGGMMR